MTRRALDAVLRTGLRHTDERYLEGCEPPVVLERGWGEKFSPDHLEEEMNPITVIKLFGQRKVAQAVAHLLSRTSAAGFDALKVHLLEAADGCVTRKADDVANALTAALFEIR